MLTTALFLCVTQSAAPAAVDSPLQDRLRDWTQRLAPLYLHQGGPDPIAAQDLLHYLIHGGFEKLADLPDRELVQRAYQRLAPNLGAGEALQVAAFLDRRALDDPQRVPEAALELLRQAPYRPARDALVQVLGSHRLTPPQLLPFLDRFLDAEGRDGILELRPWLTEIQDPGLLRSIYTHWRPAVAPGDLLLLRSLVAKGPKLRRELALQTWAAVETDADQRLRILEAAQLQDLPARTEVYRRLAAAGSDPQLTARLRSMLDVPDLAEQSLALDLLAAVSGPEVLFQEWQLRRSPDASLSWEGRWMSRLARTGLPKARRAAAEWFVHRGWQDQRRVDSMVRGLGFDPVVDPLLDGFLRRDEVPLETRLQLALERCQGSVEARDFLRRAAVEASPLRQARIAATLGAEPNDEDLIWLARVALDDAWSDMACAEAVRGLAHHPAGAAPLGRLLDQGPEVFEIAEALAQAVVLHGDPALRARGLREVQRGFGRWHGGDQASLRRSAWMAQEQRPDPFEAEELLAEWEVALEQAPDPYADSKAFPEPRQLRGHFVNLPPVTRALAASLAERWLTADGGLPELEQRVYKAHPRASTEALLMASWSALRIAPDLAGALALQAADRADIHPRLRLRALGRAVLAQQWFEDPEHEAALWDQILAEFGGQLDQDGGLRLSLAWGLDTPSPRGWLLPLDEIHQWRILALGRAGKLEAFRALLSGGCRPEVLRWASEASLEQGQSELAAELAWRAFDFEPGSSRTRWLLQRAAEARGDSEAAHLHQAHRKRLDPALR